MGETENSEFPVPAEDGETQRVRRELCGAVGLHNRNAEELYQVREKLESGAELSREEKVALVGSVMAANYGYTLAAALRLVYVHHGAEAGDELATAVDEILNNGDFDSINGDLMQP